MLESIIDGMVKCGFVSASSLFMGFCIYAIFNGHQTNEGPQS